MARIRLAPAVMVQPAILIDGDDGDLAPGPEIPVQPIPLAHFKGSRFYDDLLAALPALQAEFDAKAAAAAPNRTQRRAKTNGKVSP